MSVATAYDAVPAPLRAEGVSGADLRAVNVSAWFGAHKVLERVSLDDAGGDGHRADRPVGLRQVDVPAHPQPDARDGAVGAQLAGEVLLERRGHLRARATG